MKVHKERTNGATERKAALTQTRQAYVATYSGTSMA